MMLPKVFWDPKYRFGFIQSIKSLDAPCQFDPNDGWNAKNFVPEKEECSETFDSVALKHHMEKESYALLTGHGGLVVVDIDHEDAEELLKELPDTLTVKTPKKSGFHFYYQTVGRPDKQLYTVSRHRALTEDELRNWAKRVLKEGTACLRHLNLPSLVDVHGWGSHVVGPGCEVTTGRYEIVKEKPYFIMPISYSELVSIVAKYGTTYREQKLDILEEVEKLDMSFRANIEAHKERKEANADDEPECSLLWAKIRESVPVSRVYEHYGVPFSMKGFSKCLLSHDTKSGNDVTCKDNMRWSCSTCGESGDAFDLFQLLEGKQKKDGKTNFYAVSLKFRHLASERLHTQWEECISEYIARRKREQLPEIERVAAEFENILKAMDKKHFLCDLGGSVKIAHIKEHVFGYPEISWLPEKDFSLWYRDQPVKIVKINKKSGKLYIKEEALNKVWFNWTGKRKYHGTVFYPGTLKRSQRHYYNEWTGFALEPREGSFQHVHNHLFNIWCCGNYEYYNYLLGWFAHLLQKPHEKPGVALVVKGIQGTGKSVIMEGLIAKILGKAYGQVDKSELLSGKFNAHHYGKLLITSEESIWSFDTAAYNVLKSLITNEWITIEEKGRTPRDERSFLRLVFLSNNESAVPADYRERRYFGLETSKERANDHAYFEKLRTAIDNGEAEAFMHYLLNLDISDFQIRKQPMTKALASDFLNNLDPVLYWLYTLLNDEIAVHGLPRDWMNEPEDVEQDESFFGRRVPTIRLFKSYTAMLDDHRRTNRYIRRDGPGTQTALTQKLKAILKLGKADVRSDEGTRAIDMPDALTFRAILKSLINTDFDWDFEIEGDKQLPDRYVQDLVKERSYVYVATDARIYPLVPQGYAGDDVIERSKKGI